MEAITEGLVAETGQDSTQPSPQSTAGHLIGRDHYPFRIPETQGKAQGKFQRKCKVCADRGKHHTGKATQKYTTI